MGNTTPPEEILAHLLDQRVVVVRPSLIRILGSAADAVVLQQLNYWMPKATAEHVGERWVYKTYPEWSEETGLPSSQVKCSMQRLEAAGVVESCQPEGYSRRKWYRLVVPIGRICPWESPPAESAVPAEESALPSADIDPSSSLSESTQEILRDPEGSPGGEVVDLDRGFPEFWAVYPARGGRKVGKGKALAKWRRMTLDDRRACYHAAGAYAIACSHGETIAKDAERFLANDYWRDWLSPREREVETARARPMPLDATVAASRQQMAENTARIKAEAETLEAAPPPEHLRKAHRDA